MHGASQIGANQGEWHDRDLSCSIDFHGLVLAMAGHDLRQDLQIILTTYGWLSVGTASSPSRLRQRLRSERSCRKSCWKNSKLVKCWK
jgi:hypothetical protein